MKQCIICGQSDYKTVFKEFDIDILKCKNCGHIFSSYKTDQDYSGYFEKEIEEKDHFWWNKAHKKMYDDFHRRFIKNKKGTLLDVGCGLGYFVKKISSIPDWQVFGYEISKPAVNYAKNNLGLKNIFCGRVEDSGFPQKYFNIITLWDVIEHIPDPRPLLIYLKTILRDDGILFIHTPNIQVQLPKAKVKKLLFGEKEGGHYLEAKDHINICSAKTITVLLKQAGFSRVKFIHLHPIQSVSGSKSVFQKNLKNFWFNVAKFVYILSFGKLNLDNLFVVVRK
jgi:2-polyprenyl-3-methyl-5-hydroxy-6-metoxy-1,4-benzoquinol methylase